MTFTDLIEERERHFIVHLAALNLPNQPAEILIEVLRLSPIDGPALLNEYPPNPPLPAPGAPLLLRQDPPDRRGVRLRVSAGRRWDAGRHLTGTLSGAALHAPLASGSLRVTATPEQTLQALWQGRERGHSAVRTISRAARADTGRYDQLLALIWCAAVISGPGWTRNARPTL